MKNDTVRKVAKITNITPCARPGEITKHLHHTCPIDHCTAVPCPFKLARVVHPYQLDRARSIRAGYSTTRARQCCSQIISAWNLSFATFQSVSFFINRCQTWSIYGLWRKMRYQNVDEKIPQTSVSIMLPYNNQIGKCDSSYKAGFRFLRCLYRSHRNALRWKIFVVIIYFELNNRTWNRMPNLLVYTIDLKLFWARLILPWLLMILYFTNHN